MFSSLALAARLTKMIRCYVFRKQKKSRHQPREIEPTIVWYSRAHCTPHTVGQKSLVCVLPLDFRITCATKKTPNRELFSVPQFIRAFLLSFVSIVSLFLLHRFVSIPRSSSIYISVLRFVLYSISKILLRSTDRHVCASHRMLDGLWRCQLVSCLIRRCNRVQMPTCVRPRTLSPHAHSTQTVQHTRIVYLKRSVR